VGNTAREGAKKHASLIWTDSQHHWRVAATVMTDDVIQLGPLCSQSLINFVQIRCGNQLDSNLVLFKVIQGRW